MDRRKSLKALALGTLSVSALLTAPGCDNKKTDAGKGGDKAKTPGYGRTEDEKVRDEQLNAAPYFTDAEMKTIAILADIIIPADEHSGSATDAGVPKFIGFIVKDKPELQLPMRGGLRWLDVQSAKRVNKSFSESTPEERLAIVDDIAYPEKAKPEMSQGVAFFNLMRNLTATGFFTSKIGIKDLGYVGNTPNEWDGVPDDVLQQYGLSYDEKTLAECLKIEDRTKIMTWD
ncbi:gluconate 2-dehydrogenase subunit 3 family protein [Chitinophaga sp. CB10]|uniref:gluconate 2-dehydrogenase subunit 3 family protein n=1 Tax=Chitinophaga sp. CB10 TaxID=1891659 RepID=UPI0025B9A177|nr:gluconate 2-dehydrogenase subunit 3 family protein [Chitinophaga sp. CB10]